MSSISNNDNFIKNYGFVIQDCLDKIAPQSDQELKEAIEAIKALVESNHEVHESLKGRINAITDLLDQESLEFYGLEKDEDREKFLNLMLDYTKTKIKHFAHLIGHPKDAQEYFDNAKTVKLKAQKAEGKKYKAPQNQSILSDEDWDAWQTYKYGIQCRHEWSLTSRQMGLTIQNLHPDKIQETLNNTFVPDVLEESKVCLATILSPEQICTLNVDQVYVLGSPPLIKNFIRLLVLGEVSFDRLKNLETEKFQLIVDFAPEVIKYLTLGVDFDDLIALSVFKLLTFLFRNPNEGQETQRPSIIQKLFVSKVILMSQLISLSNQQFHYLLVNSKIFRLFCEFSDALGDFFSVNPNDLEKLNQLDFIREIKGHLKTAGIKIETILNSIEGADFLSIIHRFHGSLACVLYLSVFQQSLSENDQILSSFLNKNSLDQFFSVEQFKKLTTQERKTICLFKIVGSNPKLYSEKLFDFLKKNSNQLAAFLATFLIPQELELLNDEQIQFLNTSNFLENFYLLLKIVPFKEMMGLKLETFKVVVSSAELILGLVGHGFEFSELTTLSLQQLRLLLACDLQNLKKSIKKASFKLSQFKDFSLENFKDLLVNYQNQSCDNDLA